MRRAFLAALILAAGLPAADAAAQTATAGRVFVNVNGNYQATSTDFQDNVTFQQYAEDGSIDTDYEVKAAPVFDISGGAKVWRNLAVGIGVSRFSKSNAAVVTASIPHPFFFNRAREISGDSPALRRQETAVHVQAIYMVPVGERLEVSVFGGPSFFTVKQDLVTTVEYSESYPYDTATFTAADIEQQSESKVGFNTGVDVAYMFHPNVGVGGLVRFSRASVDFASPDGETVSVDAGGAQIGAGVRLRF
jgi:opacity protein-like surface antigen